MKRKQPETSKDALKSLNPEKIRDIYKRILEALQIIGKGTYEDISKQMKIDSSRVWKRLSECHIMGLIERTGERKALSSGRDGFVWQLTSKDLPLKPVIEKHLPGKSVSEFAKEIIRQSRLF